MPTGVSLQGFLPTNESMPTNQESCFHELLPHTKEEQLYNPWTSILRETCSSEFTQVNTWQSPEHVTYEKLRDKTVRNIAQCIVRQDVASTSLDSSNLTAHDTKTPLYFKRHWDKCKDGMRSLRTFRHYHLVLEHIDSTIIGFTSLRELVSAIRDAFIAFDDAFMEAKVLHRDISVGNIMIKRTRESTIGVLVDWDLCKELTLPSNNRHHERTGTWAFMSARLIEGAKVHSREDDVESFYHVLNYLASCFLVHNISIGPLALFIHDNFIQGAEHGSSNVKSANIIAQYPGSHISNSRVSTALMILADVLAVGYTPIQPPELIARHHADAEKRQSLSTHYWLSQALDAELGKTGWDENCERVTRDSELPAQLERSGVSFED